jgi:oxygen-independent coproporphyrinogen-3 oxidase
VHSVTCYNLRVNEKTPIGRDIADPQRLDIVRLVRWREGAATVAEECGFEQTRWHTFRRRDPLTAREAALRFRDVTGWGNQFGAGVSARSRLRDTVYRNDNRYQEYLARIESGRSPVDEVRRLDEDERRLRFVTLTLGDGLPLVREEYERTFGGGFDDHFGPSARRLVAAGVLDDDGRQIRLTPRGRLVYDLATRAFYPERIRGWMDERQALVGHVRNLTPRHA